MSMIKKFFIVTLLFLLPFTMLSQKSDGSRSKDNSNETYNIALLIPLYLDQVDTSQVLIYKSSQEADKYAPFRFIQFYQGFMTAMDSLKKSGFNVNLFVYDVDQTTESAEKVLRHPEMKEMHLIVGPLHWNSFVRIAEFAKQYEIPIVNPLGKKSDMIDGNPMVFKVQPSENYRIDRVAELIKLHYQNYRIIITRYDQYRFIDESRTLKSQLEAELNLGDQGVKGIPEVIYLTDSIPGITKAASQQRPNLVVALTDNEVFVVSLMTALNDHKNDYDFTIIGFPEWEKIEKLENQYLIEFNTHYLTSSYINYSDTLTEIFILNFRNRYFAEPNSYAYEAFDIGWYFGGALLKYGPKFYDELGTYNPRLFQRRFVFEKAENGGFENIYWNIYKYNGFTMEKLSDPWDRNP